MELSQRMQRVADMVENSRAVADIGCDHGYVSIYLVESGRTRHAYAMDVRRGPLSKAVEHVKQKALETQIECRLSDGLEKLAPGEADTLILAGMGGLLMVDILKRGSSHMRGDEVLILQPQSDIAAVRRYIYEIGYQIQAEDMLVEEGKYYMILRAESRAAEPLGKERQKTAERDETEGKEALSEVEYQYGPCLLRERHPILAEYLKKEQEKLMELQTQLEQQTSDRAVQRVRELREALELCREAKAYYEGERCDALV